MLRLLAIYRGRRFERQSRHGRFHFRSLLRNTRGLSASLRGHDVEPGSSLDPPRAAFRCSYSNSMKLWAPLKVSSAAIETSSLFVLRGGVLAQLGRLNEADALVNTALARLDLRRSGSRPRSGRMRFIWRSGLGDCFSHEADCFRVCPSSTDRCGPCWTGSCRRRRYDEARPCRRARQHRLDSPLGVARLVDIAHLAASFGDPQRRLRRGMLGMRPIAAISISTNRRSPSRIPVPRRRALDHRHLNRCEISLAPHLPGGPPGPARGQPGRSAADATQRAMQMHPRHGVKP